MTHSSTRLAHVVFGVGITIVVALAPVLFIVLSGPSASAGEPASQSRGSGAVIGSIELAEHQSVVLVIAAMACAALLAAVYVSTRVERDR